jgi:uncharacterized protein
MTDIFTPALIALATAVFVFAGFVKGVIGLGLPTISLGLLSLAMPPAQAAAMLVVPSLLTNVWQVAGAGWVALLRRLATLLVGLCVGVAVGAWLFGGVGGRAAGLLLGVALAAYAALGLASWRPSVAPGAEAWASPLAGIATGLVTAATGVFVIPAVPYLQAIGLAKDELVRALGLSFLVATLALAASLGHGGALGPQQLAASLLAVPPALIGMGFGQWLRGRLAPAVFRRWFLVGLLALGVWLVVRAAMGA